MKNIIYKLCVNSYVIVYYLFWIYFGIMIILYIFNIPINFVFTILFFLIGGIYLGFYFSTKAKDYIDKRNKSEK